jgi:methionyl-tRNA formyltransferase
MPPPPSARPSLRTVYLGTSEFAATVLERLAAGPHRPALVITRPDRPSGRGRKLTSPPVAALARTLDLPVAQPERIGDPEAQHAIERAAGAATDELLLVVCAYGALIKEPLLSAYPLLNVHPSLLPRWRGAAPIERAIMAGDPETGVSIMRLTAGLDSGPLCLAAAATIGPQETYGSLAARLATLGGELLVRVLDGWQQSGPPPFVEQDDALATYAEKIAPEDRTLDPGTPALESERRVRALQPHIGARLELSDGTMLGVCSAEALSADPAASDRSASAPGGLAPGELADVGGQLLYGTRDGALRLLEVQPPGGRPMDAGAYLRGHDPRRP